MNPDDRQQLEHVLSRIPRADWRLLLTCDQGREIRRCIDAMRAAIKKRGPQPRPIAVLIDLYGNRLLSDRTVGSWLRQRILENLPQTKWEKLAALYSDIAGERAEPLHGNMTQDGKGSQVMAGYWHQGSQWARMFCQVADVPGILALRRSNVLRHDEVVSPAEALPPLHGFQEEVYLKLRTLLREPSGVAAMLSLPTGAGKTRVAVEAICDHLAEELEARRRRNVALWIAQSEELQIQAWEEFRQVWQVAPERATGRIGRRVDLLLIRAWGVIRRAILTP